MQISIGEQFIFEFLISVSIHVFCISVIAIVCICLTMSFHRKKVSDASLPIFLLLEVVCYILLGSGLSFLLSVF